MSLRKQCIHFNIKNLLKAIKTAAACLIPILHTTALFDIAEFSLQLEFLEELCVWAMLTPTNQNKPAATQHQVFL